MPGRQTAINFENVITAEGNDHIIGTGAANVIETRGGNDKIEALFGADVVYSGAGDDSIDAGSQDDVVYAGEGDDIVDGDAGNDVVFGGAGNDNLRDDETGNDQYFGGAGDDTINAGADTDTVDAGTGDDTVIFDGDYEAQGVVATPEVMDGGEGTDTLVLSPEDNRDLTVDMSNTDANGFFGIRDFEAGTQIARSFENLISAGGDDSLTGTDGDNIIIGDGAVPEVEVTDLTQLLNGQITVSASSNWDAQPFQRAIPDRRLHQHRLRAYAERPERVLRARLRPSDQRHADPAEQPRRRGWRAPERRRGRSARREWQRGLPLGSDHRRRNG